MRSYQVVEFGHTLRDTDMLDPKPTGDEVVIAVKAAGVCHSDLHIWEGGFDLGGGRKLTLKDRGVQLPLTLGHETAGEILSIGPNVTDRKVGEMCLVYPWIGCGVCRVCRDGHENLCMKPRCLGIHCDGGYSDQLVVPHSKYLLPLEGLDPVASAPLACSGVTTYSALKKLGSIIRDEPVLVIGAGGLGLMCVSILKAMGGKGAVVVDIDERHRDAAIAAGAIAAIDGAGPDALERIAAAFSEPCKAAIDLVGSPSTAALAFELACQGRQTGHGRPVRRCGPLVVAVDPDEGRDDRGQLHRKPLRDQGTARSRALRSCAEYPNSETTAQRRKRSA